MSLDNLQKQNIEIMQRQRDELVRSQISDSETYDRSILTLSSSFLGFSIAFIHFAANEELIRILWAVIVAWSFYFISILSVLISILAMQKARGEMVDALEPYYLQGDGRLLKLS